MDFLWFSFQSCAWDLSVCLISLDPLTRRGCWFTPWPPRVEERVGSEFVPHWNSSCRLYRGLWTTSPLSSTTGEDEVGQMQAGRWFNPHWDCTLKVDLPCLLPSILGERVGWMWAIIHLYPHLKCTVEVDLIYIPSFIVEDWRFGWMEAKIYMHLILSCTLERAWIIYQSFRVGLRLGSEFVFPWNSWSTVKWKFRLKPFVFWPSILLKRIGWR